MQGLEGKRIKDLSEEELTILRDEIDKYTIEGDLRRFNSMNIRRLKEIQCYRGKRHIAVRHILRASKARMSISEAVPKSDLNSCIQYFLSANILHSLLARI